MKIIYGTTNKNKISEMKEKFKDYDIDLISLDDINFKEEIIEDGITFLENSLIKAKVIKNFCDKNNIDFPILTDDAGLCVKSLGNRPGVHTARYAGDHAPQIDCINKLLLELKDKSDRSAVFYCALTFVYNDEYMQVEGFCEGEIAKVPGKLGGFTFGPLFIPKGYDRPYNEIDYFETHRENAVKKLIIKLTDKKII